jgi:head-tail adaptor
MRFRDGGRLYRIEAVQESDATGRWLTCFAVEEVGR